MVLVEASSTMKSGLCKVILENQMLKFTPELNVRPNLCKAHHTVKEGAPQWSNQGPESSIFNRVPAVAEVGTHLP